MVSLESHLLNLGHSTEDHGSIERIHWGSTKTREKQHGTGTEKICGSENGLDSKKNGSRENC